MTSPARTGLVRLREDECRELLATNHVHVGRVAFVADGRLLVLPVNYRFYEGAVVFRTDERSPIGATPKLHPVSFQVDWVDTGWQEGWSVLVEGEVEEVTDSDELRRLRALPLYPWAPGLRGMFCKLVPTRLSGRRIV